MRRLTEIADRTRRTTERLLESLFERLNSPKAFGVVLALVIALNACGFFFVYFPSLADERRPTQASAPGELTGGGQHPAALKPPVGLSARFPARFPEAAPVKAEVGAEGTREETTTERPRRAPANASQPTAASLTEVTDGGLYAASTAASTASSASTAASTASSASTAQYAQYAQYASADVGSAAAVQSATTDATAGGEAAENPVPEFPPPGMPQWMRNFLND